MNRKDYISRYEAAEMLGVKPQTISNYVKKGLLEGKKVGSYMYISRLSLEKNEGHISEVKSNEALIEEYKSELDAQLKDYRKKIDKARRANAKDVYQGVCVVKAVLDMFSMFDVELSEKEKYAIKRYFGAYISMPQWAFADMMQMDCHYYLNKAVRKAGEKFNELNEGLKDENKRLWLRCARQHYHIDELKYALAHSKPKHIPKIPKKIIYERYELLNTKLVDMDVSVRALSCTRTVDIEYLKDLVRYKKQDLLKIRNFGKKSLYELSDLLDAYNLKFGMTSQEVNAYLTGEIDRF